MDGLVLTRGSQARDSVEILCIILGLFTEFGAEFDPFSLKSALGTIGSRQLVVMPTLGVWQTLGVADCFEGLGVSEAH